MQGQLFSQDFLTRGITRLELWRAISDGHLHEQTEQLQQIFTQALPNLPQSALNEAQTEELIIKPVLELLGWQNCYLSQVNMSRRRREDVPDVLLFADHTARQTALAENSDEARIKFGVALLEAKRWQRPLDRTDSLEHAEKNIDMGAPSSQMLRYLSRADVVSNRQVKWGILTNGALWRLYWQDARSRSEEFFELNLANALQLAGQQPDPDDPSPSDAVKLFLLLFARAAFLPQNWEEAGTQTLHQYARNESRQYEEFVADDLGRRVFHFIFPRLAQALLDHDLERRISSSGHGSFRRIAPTPEYLEEVREATLVLLYRLLFLFHAEDRRLLPVHDARYRPYSMRRIREDVANKIDHQAVFAERLDNIWRDLQAVFLLIDQGDASVGMPTYNGGLFDRARAPLLERVRLPDALLAPLLDTLSRRQAPDKEEITWLNQPQPGAWINYRDLSVAHLGGIYERLLVYSLQVDDGYGEKMRLQVLPASFARKVSGSFYTHDDLVKLVIESSVGRFATEKMATFQERLNAWKKKSALTPPQWEALAALDPATQLLKLKICDPAMGSGHFLVTLVDDLADRILEAINHAEDAVAAMPWAAHLIERQTPWVSPLLSRIASQRQSILLAAQQQGFAVSKEQLDDRHIVRRMVLKKCIYGVDKNSMAVELAKTALWLHTFTVGAPLSFLDHHLVCGDSLHGERFATVRGHLFEQGILFQDAELQQLQRAVNNLAQVSELADINITEVEESKKLSFAAQENMAPLLAVLNFWRALRWLEPKFPASSGHSNQQGKKPFDQISAARRVAIAELISGQHNLALLLLAGQLNDPHNPAAAAVNQLLAETSALAERERFFHWHTAFPEVWNVDGQGGFDIVLGNPPWDRIKLQQVEWFAERQPEIARQARAADRKNLIDHEVKKKSTLAQNYALATASAEASARVFAESGDFPLLGRGDMNLYSLFVERAASLVHAHGIVALVTPSGIAADKGAAEFFQSIATTGRLADLYDFENRRKFFPDVDSRFKFCVLVFGAPRRQFAAIRMAFFLHDVQEIATRTIALGAADFALVNPNTGAAPIFRNQRDADLTLRLYRQHPVLVDRRHNTEKRLWPVKYTTVFHMTNDSHLFIKREELVAQGFKSVALNRWEKNKEVAVPLYEGKMVQMFDHRAADVVINTDNLKRAAQQEEISHTEKANVERQPAPQYWVAASTVAAQARQWQPKWLLAFKSITAPTNMRTLICAILPGCGVGNSMGVLAPESGHEASYVMTATLLMANLSSFAFDFILRQKVQGQNLNWYILEQLPMIAPHRFQEALPHAFATKMRADGLMNGHHPKPTVADFVIPQVLALSYTAHDLADFAHDLGYVDAQGIPLPPFTWNVDDRRRRLAALDALFFYLYGIAADEAAYILSTFPIVWQITARESAYKLQRQPEDILHLLPLLHEP